jgi:predicted ATPase
MQGRELADSIVFYYFRKVGAETTIHKIRVDSSGRFVDEWPEGFFEDRMEDLFG